MIYMRCGAMSSLKNDLKIKKIACNNCACHFEVKVVKYATVRSYMYVVISLLRFRGTIVFNDKLLCERSLENLIPRHN